MTDLSERQIALLGAIIKEYVETAEPVGSEAIVQKYNLQVSPATVRNEMVELTRKGFLSKPHTSAGRIPSAMALRFFIKDLMEEERIPVVSETSLRQRLWEKRFEREKLIREAVAVLADKTGELSMATVEEGPVYYSGISNILNYPEFYDIDLTKSVLSLLDQHEILLNLFSRVTSESPVRVLIGDDLGMPTFGNCSLVYAPYDLGNISGNLGVFGPSRMDYPRIIPWVRFISDLLSELSGNW
ncbi:hypothetical protein CO181_01870 [candidate division WWE3 bacterium CG_4_9_14_3_um_filter_43_9]|uniref:Heat-inducible transcription repressor HrcA n=2 Tax=Katanobacteria TaxID=422282 RepID=A0A2M7WXS7_UNCKA|nr:MAG: hypothetical protein CO181_01870 [candidate division WWE3 bacterium CG_4_9_14_3_um_filter_43_9]